MSTTTRVTTLGVKEPLRLSARTLAWLANRPHARKLVCSIWDELAELERTGHLPDVLATVRVLLIEHQILTRTGRCLGCRHGWRRSLEVLAPSVSLRGLVHRRSRAPRTVHPATGRRSIG